MNPTELIAVADGLVTGGHKTRAGGWQRTTAALGRAAIEEALRQYWILREPGMERCSARAQLLCLRVYLGNTDLVRATVAAWLDLSRACHHHPYELNPTAVELHAWLAAARAFALEVARQAAAGGQRLANGASDT